MSSLITFSSTQSLAVKFPKQHNLCLQGPISVLVHLLSEGFGTRLWYTLGGITVTSAPVSTLNFTSWSFNLTSAFHDSFEFPSTMSTLVSWPRKNSPSSSTSGQLTSPTFFFNWDLHAFAQCPFLKHLLHLESLAGHSCLEWGVPRHLVHFVSGVLPANLEFLGGLSFWSFPLTPLPLFFEIWSTLAEGGSGWVPCKMPCCFLTASDCLAWVTAFSRVNLESSCSFSDSFLSFNPTTVLSRISSSLSTPNSQCSARQCKSVMKVSTDSPSCWLLRLNLALSNIMFLLTMKWLSNLFLTSSYCFASSAVSPNETIMSSASSPME